MTRRQSLSLMFHYVSPSVGCGVLCLLLIAFFLLPSALGQSASATLSGTVEDQKGAVVPGVAVSAVNVGTALKRTTTTNEEGTFVIPLLPPGTYTIRAEAQGFAPAETRDVVLNVGDQKSLRIELKAGSITEMVQVTGDAPLINESPAVATTIDRTFVGNLPLNGRSFQSLILLTPGATVTAAGVNDYGQFSVNGQRASTNYFTVDGVSANIGISVRFTGGQNGAIAGYYPGLSAFGGTNSLVSVDALEEFKIQTSTYSAEFGRQPGGQVSLVTRSGTNDFHGTLFEYIRNDVFDARDYFNKKPAPKPALRQNQFGGTFSGPVRLPRFGEGGKTYWNGRNRTFIFFSYEAQRLRLPVSGTVAVPSLRLRSLAAPALKPILDAFPRPTRAEFLNTAGLPSGWAPYDASFSNPGTMDAASIRIDHSFGSKLALFGRFNESPSNVTTFNGGATGTVNNTSTRTLTLGTTSVLSARLNNELRFNYSRQLGQQKFIPATYGGALPVESSLLTNGLPGLGQVFLAFEGFTGSVLRGDFAKNYQRQLNVVDNVSVASGAHQLKFGIDYRRLSPTYAVQDNQSVFIRSQAVLTSAIVTASITKNEPSHPRFTNFSAYGQDTWKVTPRLTLALGMRWELNPPPSEVDGKMPPMALGISGNTPDVSRATLAPPGTPFYKTDYTAFAPRVGIAYQLRNTQKWGLILRGGFGVYYDLGSAGAASGFPLTRVKSLAAVPFPLSDAAAARPVVTIPTSLPVTVTVYANEDDLSLPYTLQWNATLEQSLGADQALSLSYVASAARRLLTKQTLNLPPDFFCCGAPAPNPNFAPIIYTWNGPTSDYHSLQAQYKARFKRRLQALVNYTWSHAIDEVSSDVASFVLSRGNANFDVRHNMSGALSYNLPSVTDTAVSRSILSNWTLDCIVHAQSGLPVNVTGPSTVVDGILFDLRPDVILGQPFYIKDPTVPGGRRFNSAAFRDPPVNPSFPGVFRQGNFGRNVLRALPIYQIDMALGRNFALTEKLKLQFKGEVFSLFNHPNFGGYGTAYNIPASFGVASSTLHNTLGNSTFGAGFSSLYQIGGPRSVQLSARVSF